MHIRVGVSFTFAFVVSYPLTLCMSTSSLGRFRHHRRRRHRRRQHHLPLAWTEPFVVYPDMFVHGVMPSCPGLGPCRRMQVVCPSSARVQVVDFTADTGSDPTLGPPASCVGGAVLALYPHIFLNEDMASRPDLAPCCRYILTSGRPTPVLLSEGVNADLTNFFTFWCPCDNKRGSF